MFGRDSHLDGIMAMAASAGEDAGVLFRQPLTG